MEGEPDILYYYIVWKYIQAGNSSLNYYCIKN